MSIIDSSLLKNYRLVKKWNNANNDWCFYSVSKLPKSNILIVCKNGFYIDQDQTLLFPNGVAEIISNLVAQRLKSSEKGTEPTLQEVSAHLQNVFQKEGGSKFTQLQVELVRIFDVVMDEFNRGEIGEPLRIVFSSKPSAPPSL